MSPILISVLIPIYNTEDYLKRCVESVLRQTYTNFELILVDDGSSDSSGDICDKYAILDKRVKVIHKENGGSNSARKIGANIATGDYIMCLDSDDWIDDIRIQKLVDFIMKYKPDMVYMDGIFVELGKNSYVRVALKEHDLIYDCNGIQNDFIPLFIGEKGDGTLTATQWVWGIRREIFVESQKHIVDSIKVGEDFACVWLSLLQSSCVGIIENSSYHYFQRGESLSRCLNGIRDTLWLKELLNAFNSNINGYIALEKRRMYANAFFARYMVLSGMIFDLDLKLGYLYPFSNVTVNDKIIVYGAGSFGSRMVYYLEKLNYSNIVLWVDKVEKKYDFIKTKVATLKNIRYSNFDKIVIAIQAVKIAEEVKNKLIEMGIEEKKIALWDYHFSDAWNWNDFI